MLIFVFAPFLVNSAWQSLGERGLLLCALPVGPLKALEFNASSFHALITLTELRAVLVPVVQQ